MIYYIKCLHNGHLLEYRKETDKEPSQAQVLKTSEGKFCHVWLTFEGFKKFLAGQRTHYREIKGLEKACEKAKITKIIYKDADFVEVVVKHPSFFYEQRQDKPQYLANYHPDLDLEAISKDFAEKRAIMDASVRKDADELLEKGLLTKEEYEYVFS